MKHERCNLVGFLCPGNHCSCIRVITLKIPCRRWVDIKEHFTLIPYYSPTFHIYMHRNWSDRKTLKSKGVWGHAHPPPLPPRAPSHSCAHTLLNVFNLKVKSRNHAPMHSRLHFFTNFYFQLNSYASVMWPPSLYLRVCHCLGLRSGLKKK